MGCQLEISIVVSRSSSLLGTPNGSRDAKYAVEVSRSCRRHEGDPRLREIHLCASLIIYRRSERSAARKLNSEGQLNPVHQYVFVVQRSNARTGHFENGMFIIRCELHMFVQVPIKTVANLRCFLGRTLRIGTCCKCVGIYSNLAVPKGEFKSTQVANSFLRFKRVSRSHSGICVMFAGKHDGASRLPRLVRQCARDCSLLNFLGRYYILDRKSTRLNSSHANISYAV